jgi:hypothetical protein
MSKLDIELIESKILQIVKDNFLAKINEINNDKNDDIILTNIPSKNFIMNLDSEPLNSSLFINYGLADSEIIEELGSFSTVWTLFYVVYINEMNRMKGAKVRSKVLRYTRALEEIIIENSDKISKYTTLPKISHILPQDVENTERTPYKIGGIKLDIIISN